jgi:hypothetical protein
LIEFIDRFSVDKTTPRSLLANLYNLKYLIGVIVTNNLLWTNTSFSLTTASSPAGVVCLNL